MEEVLVEQKIIKGGTTWVELGLRRGGMGLEVWLKTTSEVEGLMKGLGNGEPQDAAYYSRDWYSADKGNPLRIYPLDDENSLKGYRLNEVCHPLYEDRNGRFNLSFLRIVGISDPLGVRFYVRGPISKKAVRGLKDELPDAIKRLILEYVVPFDIHIAISSQEVVG